MARTIPLPSFTQGDTLRTYRFGPRSHPWIDHMASVIFNSPDVRGQDGAELLDAQLTLLRDGDAVRGIQLSYMHHDDSRQFQFARTAMKSLRDVGYVVDFAPDKRTYSGEHEGKILVSGHKMLGGNTPTMIEVEDSPKVMNL